MPHRLISPRTASPQELDALVHVLDGADIIVHRLEGTITHWSIGCENMYGWAREEAVGEMVDALLATQYPDPVETIRAHLKSRGFWQGEIIHRHKSGHDIHVATRCVLVNLSDGDPAVIQANSDISALKKAEEAVRSREDAESPRHVVHWYSHRGRVRPVRRRRLEARTARRTGAPDRSHDRPEGR